MGINDDWYWRGLESGKLGVRFAWSEYLPHLIRDNELVDEWEEFLQSEVDKSTKEALATDSDRLKWNTEISQVGSAAEEYHEVFLWIQDLPKEIITGLLVLGAERTLSAFYAHIRHRIEAIRRRFGDQEVTVEMRFHPDTLLELCKEHVVASHEVSLVGHTIWMPRVSKTYASPDPNPIPDDLYLVVLRSDAHEFSYLVDPTAKVLDHRIDHVEQDKPELVPNVQTPSDDSFPVAIPQGFDWPSQDGVDRSEHIAILAGGHYGPVIPDEATKPLLQEVTRQAVADVLPGLAVDGILAEDHEIGPAAGAVEDFVVTLYENREALALALSTVVDSWAVFEIVSRIRRKLRSDSATHENRGQPIRFWMPAGTLAMLCEDYVRRAYHPRAHLQTEWYCLTREFWFGYVSPAHPNESIEYLILVSTSKESYRFKLLGTGEVTSHSVRRGRLDAALPLPDLFAENGDISHGHHP